MRMNIRDKQFKIVFTTTEGAIKCFALSKDVHPIIANFLPRIDTEEVACPALTPTAFTREVIKLATNK